MTEDIRFRITPKNKKLLKSSKVRAYFKHIHAEISRAVNDPDFKKKFEEAFRFGLPYRLYQKRNGKIGIRVIKPRR